MKKSFLIVLALAAITTATLIACQPGAAGNKIEKPVVISKDSLVKRGSYLVYTMLCDDCHSPKRMGLKGPEIIPELRLSGARQDGKLPPLDIAQIEKKAGPCSTKTSLLSPAHGAFHLPVISPATKQVSVIGQKSNLKKLSPKANTKDWTIAVTYYLPCHGHSSVF